MSNPYVDMEARAFWRTAVAERNPLEMATLHRPKYRLAMSDKIVTAGSCFAQHIGNALRASGFNWLDCEPAPRVLDSETRRKFNYGVFSFRTGNIYTTALLLQWIRWALKHDIVPQECWCKDGRAYDPFRPAIEPGGFLDVNEMLSARERTLRSISDAIYNSDVFVFTMGLTECWRNIEQDYIYAMCPGTVAGTFDPNAHKFVNLTHAEVLADFESVVKLCRAVNPSLKFLLTVSPVPLTATAAGDHVIVATAYSKGTLRSVAGELSARYDYVDYFPSFEIITAPSYRGMFYKPNQREVSTRGVEFVMEHFFRSYEIEVLSGEAQLSAPRDVETLGFDEIVCEDALLDAFEITVD